MTRVHVDESFRREFFSIARRVRESQRWVAPEVLAVVLGWLTEFRAGVSQRGPILEG